jgi:hypothetical protein
LLFAGCDAGKDFDFVAALDEVNGLKLLRRQQQLTGSRGPTSSSMSEASPSVSDA